MEQTYDQSRMILSPCPECGKPHRVFPEDVELEMTCPECLRREADEK